MTTRQKELAIRPYQLMEITARLGAGRKPNRLGDKRLTEILMAIKANPRIPVKFTSYEGKRYNGHDAGAPDGVLFHVLWDMEILEKFEEKLSLYTGFFCLWNILRITTTEGICTFKKPAAKAWKGSATVRRRDYEKGLKKVEAFCRSILPSYTYYKSPPERAEIRKRFVNKVLYKADEVRIFPSHLLWAVCVYGTQMVNGHGSSIDDNLFEVGEVMRRNPQAKVILVPDHCMVCPGCGGDDPGGAGLCGVKPMGMKPAEKMGLGNLRILRSLGLEFFEPVAAGKLVRMVKDRIPLDHPALTYKGSPPNPDMVSRALQAGMGFLEAYEDMCGLIKRVKGLLARRDIRQLLPSDDSSYMKETLQKARRAVADGRRKDAYKILIDERFWICWKTFLEKAPLVCARLPGTIKTEARKENGPRAITACKTKGNIICDGRLNEGAWRKGVFSAGFSTVCERPALAETGVQALYDEDNLYIGVLCAERDTRRLKTEARIGTEIIPHDRVNQVIQYRKADDGLAIIIQPDETALLYFNFIINAKGVKLGQRLQKKPVGGSAKAGVVNEYLRENEWRASAHVLDNRLWSVEAVIPFKILELKNESGRNPRINFERFFRNDIAFHQVWSWDDEKVFMTSNLGRLLFDRRIT